MFFIIALNVKVQCFLLLSVSYYQVLSMSMDLFIARTVITKASLIYRGPLEITEIQVDHILLFH